MLDRIFDPENRFWTFANKMADLVVLEFLTFVCCLPLVTVGAAFSAFWRMTLALVKDEEPRIFSGYFRTFRERFLTGTAAWLAHLALAGFLSFDALLSLRMGTVAGAFLGGLFAALLLLLSLALLLPSLLRLLQPPQHPEYLARLQKPQPAHLQSPVYPQTSHNLPPLPC